MLLKVIACEIAARELYYTAARSRNQVDLEFLTQGHHDVPNRGREEVQKRIDAVASGKYEAILLGYGLCSSILAGLTTAHTPLVIPRAHDCITLFLGSRTRYQEQFSERPGTYYYTSGWLECAKRRGEQGPIWGGASLPAGANTNFRAAYDQWVLKYGEEQANYLMGEMNRWTAAYSHGTLIDFEFIKDLDLRQEVQAICAARSWQYDEIKGDLGLFERLLDGQWDEPDFLTVHPGQRVVATFDERVINAQAVG